MAPEPSRPLKRVTFVLLALASAAVEVAAAEGRPLAESLGLAALWVGLAAALSRVVPAPRGNARVPPWFVLLVPAGLLAAPFVVEPLRRSWLGDGYPLELQLVLALRNLGLGLAACAAWRTCLRLASVVSLFLILFAISMTDNPAVLALLGLYGVAGSVWLMLAHWSGLGPTPAAGPVLEVRPGRQRLPWPAALGVVVLVSSTLTVLAAGPQRATRILGELLPTSGGTGAYDPFARSGLNDGDDEVKGNNPRSTGMTPTDTFLDSPLPSLYDMFNDLYGEPVRRKEVERAIALAPQTQVGESGRPPASNLRPSREFATVRRPRQARHPSDRAARALFEVQGRTPLHIRAAAFDRLDGRAWQEAPYHPDSRPPVKETDSCWMRLPGTPPRLFAAPEAHQLKVAASCGSLVPTPPHLTRFRVGRVDRADFFAWGQPGVLRLADRKLPSGVCVETESCAVDPRQLPATDFQIEARGETRTGPGLPPALQALAGGWTAGRPHGWPQIEAVVRRLRSDYTLDPDARPPEDCRAPLAHFLLETRRGPDYQFAGAAAVLLRGLGYQTRLVSGFYAAPEHYDPLTRHTPVAQEDLHFWAEVRLPSGHWLVLEPTPGYDVLAPAPTWYEQAVALLLAAAAWAWAHAAELGAGLAAAGLLGWKRRELADAAAAAWWRCFPGASWQQAVRGCSRLLERRCRWAGRPRPCCRTAARWLRSALAPEAPADVEELARMLEWAAYAPTLSPPWPDAEVHGVCRHALAVWTLKRLRAASPPGVSR